jgi:hypothetical protein
MFFHSALGHSAARAAEKRSRPRSALVVCLYFAFRAKSTRPSRRSPGRLPLWRPGNK